MVVPVLTFTQPTQHNRTPNLHTNLIICQLTSATWYIYRVTVATETVELCDRRYLFSGPSLANSITNMMGSSTQIPVQNRNL